MGNVISDDQGSGAVVPLPEGVQITGSGSGPMQVGEAHVGFAFDAAPDAAVHVCLDSGRMVGLVIIGDMSARALQRIPLRTLERAAVARVRMWRHATLKDTLGVKHPIGGALQELMDLALGDEEAMPAHREARLARFAARYVQACATSGTPTKDLAEEDGVRVGTARDRLHAARRAGLLTAAGAGIAGGDLTAKAVALLSVDEEA